MKHKVPDSPRHVLGSKLYGGGGYFKTEAEAQAVLKAFHSGAARVVGRGNNNAPIVIFKKVTGFNNNRAAGYLNQPTHRFMIKGTKKVSVVPVSPKG